MAATLSPSAPESASYLGRGIYDVVEVARLLCRARSRVEGWTRSGSRRAPLLTEELAGLFSFWDLLSLRVIAELIDRSVTRDHIRTGAEHLARSLGTDRPFAHEKLATAGQGFFADVVDDAGWEDVGQGGQLAFQQVVMPFLHPLTFDESGMASIWRPHADVWINPAVQAGTPCVDGTRTPTRLIADLLDFDDGPAEDDIHEVAGDYRLTNEQVRAALDYEHSLAA